MTNFSPFFPGSEGLVTSADLAPSFSEAGVAAHNTPVLREKEMMRKMKIDLLYFDFIVSPKKKKLFPLPLPPPQGGKERLELFYQNLMSILILRILNEGKM
jgi:hypothetical protein